MLKSKCIKDDIKRQPAVQKPISCECKTKSETSREIKSKKKLKVPEKKAKVDSEK